MKIAIDGPAGSGKSTIAKKIAEKMHIIYIDTGAMYRAVTFDMLCQKIGPNDEKNLEKRLNQLYMNFIEGHMMVNEVDVSVEIRTPNVTRNVSDYSKSRIVREKMQHYQRQIADNQSVIMDGRDIGTEVLPDADLKIYLVASVEERARRRLGDLEASGYNSHIHTLIQEIEKRDYIDSSRELSPLRKADDAVEIDTSSMTIDEVIDEVMRLVAEVNNVSNN
jgi:cytidylate kinase